MSNNGSKSLDNQMSMNDYTATTPLSKVRLINLPKFSDSRGNLTFVESNNGIPFELRRIYYLYDVPCRSERGAHAHKKLHQLVIAASGNFTVELDDGFAKKTYKLDSPSIGLYLVPGIWRKISNFSQGSLCLVLASHLYDPDDYIHDYSLFQYYALNNEFSFS